MASQDEALAAKERHGTALVTRYSAHGIGLTQHDGAWSIQLFVPPSAVPADPPEPVDGVPVRVQASTPFKA